MKLVQAWIEIHREELMENWKLAIEGEKPFKINSLKKKKSVLIRVHPWFKKLL